MKTIILPLLAFTAGAFLIPSTSDAAPGGAFGSKLRSRLTIDVELVATVEGTVGSSGSASIKVKQKDAVQTAKLELSVNGLPAGAYSLDATLDDSTAVHLGDFEVAVAPAPVAGTEDESGSVLAVTLPAELDARTIATMTVSNSAAVVVLEGDASAAVDRESFFANVAVTGGEGSRVHGTRCSSRRPKRVSRPSAKSSSSASAPPAMRPSRSTSTASPLAPFRARSRAV